MSSLKVLLPVLAAALTASALSAEEYKSDGRSQSATAVTTVTTGSEGGTFAVAGDPAVMAWSTAFASPGSGGVSVTSSDPNAPQPKVWMGVNLADPSEALESQLQIEGGAVVVNVVKDSPAAQAGVQRFDVITAVDGQPIINSTADVVRVLSNYEPGATVRVDLVRKAAPVSIHVTLAQRPAQPLEWSFDFAPDALVENNTFFHGKMLQRDDDGNWQMQDFGKLDPGGWQQFFPGQNSFSSSLYVDNDKKSVRILSNVNGVTLIVDERDDGTVSVKRVAAGGDTSETVYDNRDHLQAEDAEAFDLLTRTHVQTSPFGAYAYSFDPSLSGTALDEEATKRLEEAQKSMRDALQNFYVLRSGGAAAGAGDPGVSIYNDAFKNAYLWTYAHPFGQGGKPSYSFKVLDGGAVEVRIRKGDSEIVKQFSSDADMQRRSPDLYQRYRGVEAAD